jgi:hypothetical protein
VEGADHLLARRNPVSHDGIPVLHA